MSKHGTGIEVYACMHNVVQTFSFHLLCLSFGFFVQGECMLESHQVSSLSSLNKNNEENMLLAISLIMIVVYLL